MSSVLTSDLIAALAPVVRRLARAAALSHELLASREELEGVAWAAICEHAGRYDPERSAKTDFFSFRAWAGIHDHLRKIDPLTRGERDAAGCFRANGVRRPESLKVRARARRHLPLSAARAERIAAPGRADDDLLRSDQAAYDQAFLDALFCPYRSPLSSEERYVLASYYRSGSTLREIGAELGVTEARACQIKGQAIETARRWARSASANSLPPHANS